MKIPLILGLGAVMTLPAVALSEAPINNEALGRVEGTLAFCAKVDPHSADKYQERTKLLTRDHDDKEVQTARESNEYRNAFDSINVELGKASNDDAVNACTAFLEGK